MEAALYHENESERRELQLVLPAGSWLNLTVNGSMLKIVRPVLELGELGLGKGWK